MTKGLFSSVLLSLFIILSFGIIVYLYTENIPSFDDFDATLGFLRLHYLPSSSSLEKLKLLFHPHNEHYILLSRLSLVTDLSLFGKINFAGLIWYQNLYLVGTYLLILFFVKRKLSVWPTLLIPITVFLFNLAFWQVALFYWGGIQYYSVVFFVLLSLFSLHCAIHRSSWLYFALAAFAALMATFSFSNGLLVFPLGLFLLFARKDKKYVYGWLLLFGIALLFYILGYRRLQSAQPPFHIFWMVRLLFTYLGSFLYVNPGGPKAWSYANIILCFITGVGIFVYWIRLFWTGYAFRNPLLYTLFSFPILTGFLIALVRYSLKAAGGIAPRYMFFSAFIPIFLILILWDTKKLKSGLNLPLILVSLLIWGMSFVNNRIEIAQTTRDLSNTMSRWYHDRTTPLIYYNPSPTFSETLSWSLENHIYELPSIYQLPKKKTLSSSSHSTP